MGGGTGCWDIGIMMFSIDQSVGEEEYVYLLIHTKFRLLLAFLQERNESS